MEYDVKVDVNVTIHIQDLNPMGKKTILFLHGWPLNHKAYEYQFNQLPQMGYRCIGMDTRGFGQSSKPYKGYSYNRLADDVRAVVEALRLNNFILAGHSMGGATAIRYMSRHKGYGVSKLALFGAAAPSVTKRPDFPFGLPKEEVTKLINQTYNNRPDMLVGLNDQFFYQKLSEPILFWFTQLGLEAAGWSTAQCVVTFRDEFLLEDLKKIKVPTLILHSIHDAICVYPLAEIMHREIKDAKLVPFENSGHGLFYEEKDKFNRELIDFIG
jgi:non-heme chloroperoxidase